MADSKLNSLLERFTRRERLALARLITLVENRSAQVSTVMEQIYPQTGHAYIVGITGAPGAGKSTLVNRLIAKYRTQGKLVAVLAIDPSSPFSGGAVLGDRVRMTDHYKDPGVYIRSVSTRGHHGGLSRAAREIVKEQLVAAHISVAEWDLVAGNRSRFSKSSFPVLPFRVM